MGWLIGWDGDTKKRVFMAQHGWVRKFLLIVKGAWCLQGVMTACRSLSPG